MQLTSNTRLIELISATLERDIFPDMASDKARAVADMVRSQLAELGKRATHLPSWLAESLAAGSTLEHEMRGLVLHLSATTLGTSASDSAVTSSTEQADLLMEHARLTEVICSHSNALQRARSRHLSQDDQQSISNALLKAAQWEALIGSRQRSATNYASQMPSSDPLKGSLTQEIAQAFLRTQHPDEAAIEVARFETIPGGFGKQTSRLIVYTAAGEEQVLIARKMDPAPLMMTGLFCVEREFHLLRSLSATGYPSPSPLYLGKNVAGIDADFYIMEKLPGRVPGSYLAGMLGASSDEMILDIAEKLAALHQIPLEAISGYLLQYESPSLLTCSVRDCYVDRIAKLRRYHTEEAEHLASPYLIYLADWLERHLPNDPRRPVLVHGDFNIHNLLVLDDRVSGVLDWECAGFGAPEQDLAYIQPHISRLIDWERFLRRYEECVGRTVDRDRLPYYMAFSMFPVSIAMNRGILNVQSANTRDVRYAMIESTYGPQFMEMGIGSTTAAEQREAHSDHDR